jgi:hypothetical protein
MTDQSELVISSYLDGEPVAAAAVLAALDTEAGQRALIDFTRLRVAAAGDHAPSAEFYAHIRHLLPTVPARPRRPLAWPVAAALAASLAIGIWAGSALVPTRHSVAPSNAPSDSPPKAVRVFEFQPGVDWHQSSAQEVVR